MIEFIKENYQLISIIMVIVLGLWRYKFIVDYQVKSLAKHEERVQKQFDKIDSSFTRHDQAIDGMIQRINAINTEFTFMKGWLSGKNL